MILEPAHLDDTGFEKLWIAMAVGLGKSHNVRKFVPIKRQLTDNQILRLVERRAVIGGMLDCWAIGTSAL